MLLVNKNIIVDVTINVVHVNYKYECLQLVGSTLIEIKWCSGEKHMGDNIHNEGSDIIERHMRSIIPLELLFYISSLD
jgi:hypothetical protein